MNFPSLLRLLAALTISITSVWATYIDDTSSSIQYWPPASWVQEAYGFDTSLLYGGTV
jgi:hypothetical protein